MDPEDGVTTLVDVLQLSHENAQFLLQVGCRPMYFELCQLKSIRNITTMPQEPSRNIVRILIFSSKRSASLCSHWYTGLTENSSQQEVGMNLLLTTTRTYQVRLKSSGRSLHEADCFCAGYRIDASDDVSINVRGAAPSRPPSRTSFRDEPIDLSPEHRAGTRKPI
jgi:hypothetical protein